MSCLSEISAPDFWKIYVGLWVVLGALGRLAGWWVDRRATRGMPPRALDLFQLAYLRGGLPAVAQTAFISLVRKGLVTPELPRGATRSARARTPSSLAEPERIIYGQLPTPTRGTRTAPGSLQARVKLELEAWESRQRRTLTASGHLLPGPAVALRLTITCSIVTTFALGGLLQLVLRSPDSPAGFLVFLIVSGTIALWLLRPRGRTTRRARALLTELKTEYLRADLVHRHVELTEGSDTLLVGVAAVGTEVLAPTGHATLHRMLSAPAAERAGSSDDEDASSCSSCSSCGACGGCGGCGGCD